MKFDAVIIGTGQAGVPLAGRLAKEGYKTAVIEKSHYGGTCVNTGCTPTKAYVASAAAAHSARRSHELGVRIDGSIAVDLPAVKARKDRLVQDSRDSLSKMLEETKHLTVIHGHARFTDTKTLTVDGQQLSADKIFINVGAHARIPDHFQQLDYLTNASILELEQVPEHLLIIGGSYVGLEFAQMFRRFGSKVTVIEKENRLLGKEDEDISRCIKEILENGDIDIRLDSECIKGEMQQNGVLLHLGCRDGSQQIKGTHVLMATGRSPNTQDLGLKEAGIATDDHGYIKVNDRLETNVEGIWALGDCNGQGAFTHTSVNDAHIVIANMFDGADRKISDRIMCYALYIDPPLGRAGMTLQQAKAAGHTVKLAAMPMKQVARAKEKGKTQGMMKIVIDADTDKILGGAILGVGGDEIIHSIIDVMYAGAPYTLIRDAMHIHPTVSELIPTMLKEVKKVTG